MLKWAGAILVVCCSSLLSMSQVLRSRQRVRALNALLDGLCLLRGELRTVAPPMPTLLTDLSRSAPQPAAEFFGAAAERLRQGLTFSEAWENALRETESLELLPEEQQALLTLGAVLGRDSAEAQCAEAERTEARLKLFLELEQKERMKQGKVYAAVGTGAGAMLAILLL